MKATIIKTLILFTLSHNLYASSLNLNWTISLADYFNTNNYAVLVDLEAYIISDEYIVVSASLYDTNSINTYYNDAVLVTNGIENIGSYGPVLVINTNGTIVFSDELFSTNSNTQFEQYPFTLPENNFLIISETYDYQSYPYGDVPITKSYVYSYSGTQGELFTKEVFNFSIINVDRSSIIDHEGVLYGIDPINLTFSQYSSNFNEENDNTEPAADTNKYFLSEIVDLRVGSQTFGVSNGNATIRMYVDESSDLTSTWSNTQHVLELDIPADADTKFYRFRMD